MFAVLAASGGKGSSAEPGYTLPLANSVNPDQLASSQINRDNVS